MPEKICKKTPTVLDLLANIKLVDVSRNFFISCEVIIYLLSHVVMIFHLREEKRRGLKTNILISLDIL